MKKIVFAVLLFLASCGGGEVDYPPSPPSPPVKCIINYGGIQLIVPCPPDAGTPDGGQ